MPAFRRKIYRQGTEQLVGRSIAPFRGKVAERNIRQIERAADNLIVLQGMKFEKAENSEPDIYVVERDVSEFVILKYSRLMLICRCDIWLDNSQKLLSNVEVQSVINCFYHLIFGPC